MKHLLSIFAAGVLGAAALGVTASTASAAVVCNAGECWHTTQSYTYPPEARVIVHPNEWKWKEGENYKWREHEGRGYWNKDEWRTW
jgi:hypothetical protein